MLGNLHDRVGEEEQLRGRTGDGTMANGAWVRLVGWSGHRDGGALGIYSEKGPEYDYDLQAIQGGFDIYRAEGENGVRDHAGI